MFASAARHTVRFAATTVPVLLLLGCDDRLSPAEPEAAAGPLAAAVAAPLSFLQVDAGTLHTCAITPAGKAWCWGSNSFGELGNGTANSSRPVAVGGGHEFIEIRAGTSFSCGLTADDRAWCWGSNHLGQLGNGATSVSNGVPAPVAGGRRYRHIYPGLNHTCALTFDDVAFCWGENDAGQLGDGTTTNRSAPVRVRGGLRFKAVRAGGGQSCGLATDGLAWCWGLNNVGQLGDGTTTQRLAPVRVSGGRVFTRLTVGGASACGLAPDQRAWCWGVNNAGELGDGTTAGRRVRPVLVAGDHRFTGLSQGDDHGCGVLTSGATWCWGRTYYGAVGDGSPLRTGLVVRAPVAVVNGSAFEPINSGPIHTCALDPAGRAYCWGWNAGGQLGDGTSEDRSVPVAVLGP